MTRRPRGAAVLILPLVVLLGVLSACGSRSARLDPDAARIVIYYDASAAPDVDRIARLHVWRSANPLGPFECVTESSPVPAPVSSGASVVYVDRAVSTGETWYYYLEAERTDGTWAKVTRTVAATAVVLDVPERHIR